jgi:type II secretory pathway predicted ATPase ExeA
MYEAYWQFNHKPFDQAHDEQSYYPAEAHRAVMLQLRYAIENRGGAAMLVGPGGSGKTLLVQRLKQGLAESFAPFVHLVFPQLDTENLLAYLADELGAPPAEGHGANANVRRIQSFLAKNAAEGRHAVVVVDEAHLIEDSRTFEALRLLLNFQTEGRPALTLLLAGQPPLLSAVSRMPQLEDRLAVKCVLRPLTADETAGYVQHRLTAAGTPQTVFNAQALDTLYYESQGLPRRINRLCDLALLIGYAEEQPAIGAEQIDAVSRELTVAVAE